MKHFYRTFILIFLSSSLIKTFAQEQSDKVKLFEVNVMMTRVQNETDRYGRKKQVIIYDLFVTNKYPKGVDTYRGLVKIKDLYGEVLKIFRIDISLSKSNIIGSYRSSSNSNISVPEYKEIFDPNDRKSVNMSTVDFKQCDVSFEAEYIHFTNGTQTFKNEYISRQQLLK